MSYSAWYDDEPRMGTLPSVTINVGDAIINSRDPNFEKILTSKLGRNVTLDTLRPKEDLEYYRRSSEEQPIEEVRNLLGLEEGEPFPDFSEFPDPTFQFSTPPGTFFDAYPLLVMTTNSMKRLQQLLKTTRVDERRFRPNLVIDASEHENNFIENGWRGNSLQIGETIIKLTLPCPRCVMTTHAFQDLEKAPKIMRALVNENHHTMGIYGKVTKSGMIKVGDSTQLLQKE